MKTETRVIRREMEKKGKLVPEALDDQTRSSSPPQQSSSGLWSALQDNNNNSNNPELGFQIDLDWNAGDDEDQVTLRLQSQVMVVLPLPQDKVVIRFRLRSIMFVKPWIAGNAIDKN
ncbi:hypothetical protein L1887_18277 [Cichorium endivia]|nr:hypothetical protein L1887_18277 [Cichorium endivia]